MCLCAHTVVRCAPDQDEALTTFTVHNANVVAAFGVASNRCVDTRNYQKGDNHPRKGMTLTSDSPVNDIVDLKLGQQNHHDDVESTCDRPWAVGTR